jgi:phosphatidylglycerophosphate synthase
MEKMTIERIRSIAQPPFSVSSYVFSHAFWIRKISIYFSLFFIYIGISAYHVLFLVGICFIIGDLLLAMESGWLRVYGGLLIFFGGFLDFCDGEVARLKKQTSILGIWHDRIWHELTLPLLWLCVGYSQYMVTDSLIYLYFGFAMTVFGPWTGEVDDRAKQVTLSIVAMRDGLTYNSNMLNFIHDHKKSPDNKNMISRNRIHSIFIKNILLLFKFPIRIIQLFSEMELLFLITALIDIYWNGIVIFDIKITALGSYLILYTILIVPSSIVRIISSALNREIELFVKRASAKIKLIEK